MEEIKYYIFINTKNGSLICPELQTKYAHEIDEYIKQICQNEDVTQFYIIKGERVFSYYKD
jgi:hypothetical protein